jgi:hypothetical protein
MKGTALLPRTRRDGLVIRELDDETLVYDTERDEAHCLNQTAALVWEQCDGKTTVAGMVSVLKKKLHSSADADIVLLAVKQLQRFHLVESSKLMPAARSVSRRDLVLKYAPAALALPVIMSISAPTPAQAGSPCTQPSNRGDGCPCSSDSQCQGGTCSGGTCQTL